MQKPTILIIWSNYYEDLAKQQLEVCLKQISSYNFAYQVETVTAGTYEIPTIIQHFHQTQTFDGYLSLSLLLKGKTDHYEFIWEHVKECFVQFALQGITLGNGIITAPNIEVMRQRVANGERTEEALNALDYLIRLKNKSELTAQVLV